MGKEHPTFAKEQVEFVNTDQSKKPKNTDKVTKGPAQAWERNKISTTTEIEAALSTKQGQN